MSGDRAKTLSAPTRAGVLAQIPSAGLAQYSARLTKPQRTNLAVSLGRIPDQRHRTIPIHKASSGEIEFEAAIFVAVLGASSYTFAEASVGQDLASWIGSHARAFGFFGGVTALRRII